MAFFEVSNLTGGINSSAEENDLLFLNTQGQGAEARDIENFVPILRGGQQKTKGFSLYQKIGTNAVTGLYRFIKSDGSTYFLSGSGSKIYQLVNGSTSDIGASISNNAWIHFETAIDRCLISDGINSLQAYDGNTLTTLSSGSPNILQGVRASLFYQNRVWVFGNAANPSLVYYSNPNNPVNGYSTQFINCDTNDGQSITAITKFFIPGKLQPVILVAKQRSIGMITGDGSLSNPYTYVKVNSDTGVPGFRQFVQFGQDVAYLTFKGVSTLQTDLQFANLQYVSLSDKVENYFLNLSKTLLKDAHTVL